MALKIIGAILVIAGCGSVGFKITLNYKRDENALEQLVSILDFMHCQLQYRMTPLPSLCRQVATDYANMPGRIFEKLATEMELQSSISISQCMTSVLSGNGTIPPITRNRLIQLGNTMGRFDLEGQLKGLEAVRQECVQNLKEMRTNRDVRLRSYQTLGLCAGAALAILFI